LGAGRQRADHRGDQPEHLGRCAGEGSARHDARAGDRTRTLTAASGRRAEIPSPLSWSLRASHIPALPRTGCFSSHGANWCRLPCGCGGVGMLGLIGLLTGPRFGTGVEHAEFMVTGGSSGPVVTLINHVARENVSLALNQHGLAVETGFAVHGSQRVTL